MSIEGRLIDFISDPRSHALVLRGGWGQGKTHLWKKLAEDHVAAHVKYRRNYAYVSLFGMNSLADLRNALAVNIRPAGKVKEDTFLELLSREDELDSKMSGLFHWGSSKVRKGAGAVAGAGVSVPHLSNVGPLYLAFAYSTVKSALICIDDIERRGRPLDLKDVLGLVADLVNERGCSVVAILNDGTLTEDDQKLWDQSREKVFMGEIRLPSSCKKAIGYVYDTSNLSSDAQVAVNAIEQLNVLNVRIIQRIKDAIERIMGCLPDNLLAATRRDIIRALAMIVYCHAGQGEGAPPLGMLHGSQLIRDVVDQLSKGKGKSAEKSASQKVWDDLFRRYGHVIQGKLEELLEMAVDNGYADELALKSAVADYDEEIRSTEQEQQLTDAWHLFHDKIGDNTSEVIDAMHSAVKNAASHLSAHNADPAIALVRRLGNDAVADKMVTDWIDPRRGDRWEELSPDRVSAFGQLQDDRFVEAIRDVYLARLNENLPTLDEIMEKVIAGQMYADHTIDRLNQSSIEEYVEYFERNGLRGAANILAVPGAAPSTMKKLIDIRRRVATALKRIGLRNQIDRIRVEALMGNLDNLPDDEPPGDIVGE